jgi:hypothetical protein
MDQSTYLIVYLKVKLKRLVQYEVVQLINHT